MSDPLQDDLSGEADHLVERTPNGQKPEDPDNSDVSQDPNFVPEGSETEK
jgi:hypothetical protein